MDLINSFIYDNKTHNISILYKDGEPLLKALDIGKVLNIKKIRNSINTFDDDEKVVLSIDTDGGKQDTMFLTEYGVIRLLLLSRQPIAKPFRKWVQRVVKQIRETGKYELENPEKYKKITDDARHHSLAEAYDKKYVTYIAFVKCIGDKKLIKIGSTKDLKTRSNDLNDQLGNFKLLKVFECSMHEKFERFLQKHKNIVIYKFKEPVTVDERSSFEVFLVTDEEITNIMEIAKRNVHKFRNTEQHIPEFVKQMQIMTENIDKIFEQLKEFKTEIQKKNSTISALPENVTIKKRSVSRGNKIQRYCKEGKTLLKTYNTFKDITEDKEVNIQTDSPSQIKLAMKNNTLYVGFRWKMLDRSLPDTTVQKLDATVESVQINKSLVAMLDIHKKEIVKVYGSQKDASKDRNLKGGAAIAKAIKNGSICRGHYFKIWDKCDVSLREHYLKNNTLPLKTTTSNAQRVCCEDNAGNVYQYSSIKEVEAKYRVSRKTIQDAVKDGSYLKGFKWKFMD